MHITWFGVSWHPERLLKKYPFWKYESWFSSEVSKLISVQNKLNLSLKYWVNEAKVGFWICYCPKNWSKYHLDTIQTTFSEKNNHLGTIWVKMSENALFQGYFTAQWVLTLQREISSHIFKMAIFSKKIGDINSRIIR